MKETSAEKSVYLFALESEVNITVGTAIIGSEYLENLQDLQRKLNNYQLEQVGVA